jgi:hypothetical protein
MEATGSKIFLFIIGALQLRCDVHCYDDKYIVSIMIMIMAFSYGDTHTHTHTPSKSQ